MAYTKISGAQMLAQQRAAAKMAADTLKEYERRGFVWNAELNRYELRDADGQVIETLEF